jgi:hypothetical protein
VKIQVCDNCKDRSVSDLREISFPIQNDLDVDTRRRFQVWQDVVLCIDCLAFCLKELLTDYRLNGENGEVTQVQLDASRLEGLGEFREDYR